MKESNKPEAILHQLAMKDNRYFKESKNKEIVNILYSQNRRASQNDKDPNKI